MNETMLKEILSRLDVLGEKLGHGGEYMFRLAVRQSYIVDGWYAVILGVVFLALGIIAAFVLAKGLKIAAVSKTSAEAERGLNWVVPGVILLVISLIGVVVNLFGGISHVLNPEYYAIMDLARRLTGK